MSDEKKRELLSSLSRSELDLLLRNFAALEYEFALAPKEKVEWLVQAYRSHTVDQLDSQVQRAQVESMEPYLREARLAREFDAAREAETKATIAYLLSDELKRWEEAKSEIDRFMKTKLRPAAESFRRVLLDGREDDDRCFCRDLVSCIANSNTPLQKLKDVTEALHAQVGLQMQLAVMDKRMAELGKACEPLEAEAEEKKANSEAKRAKLALCRSGGQM